MVEEAANIALNRFEMRCDPHGPVTVKLMIGEDGRVEHARLLLDRLAFPDGSSTEGMAESIVEEARSLRFPAASAPTETIVPVMVGGPLPWMKR